MPRQQQDGRHPAPAAHDVWRSLVAAHRGLSDRLDGELRAKASVPLTWYEVLQSLGQAPGQRLRMTDLALALPLSKSGLTRLVDRLCSARLVERDRDPGDLRGVVVVLTSEGRAALQRAGPVCLHAIERHFASHLTPDECAVLGRALSRISERLAR